MVTTIVGSGFGGPRWSLGRLRRVVVSRLMGWSSGGIAIYGHAGDLLFS